MSPHPPGPLSDIERLKRVFGTADWTWLRQRLRKAIEAGRGFPTSVSRKEPSHSERRAYNSFFGTPGRTGTLRVDVPQLQQRLQDAGLAPDLLTALGHCDGPVINFKAEREEDQSLWLTIQHHAMDVLPQYREQIQESFQQGLWRRLSAGDSEQARQWIESLKRMHQLLKEKSHLMLAELAASIDGNAHLLDRGQPLGRLALRIFGQGDTGEGVLHWRQAWRNLGVIAPETTAPVLVHGLHWENIQLGEAWNLSLGLGEPLRLTFRALEKAPRPLPHGPVHVCENPTVVEAAARRFGPHCQPILCTDGQPSSAALLLLQMLERERVPLLYHGDADWAGITIANGLFQQFTNLSPWRFDAEELSRHRHCIGPKLEGIPVDATWDVEFKTALSQRDMALHEETVLEDLLRDLGES